jgi:hypothetical protein
VIQKGRGTCESIVFDWLKHGLILFCSRAARGKICGDRRRGCSVLCVGVVDVGAVSRRVVVASGGCQWVVVVGWVWAVVCVPVSCRCCRCRRGCCCVVLGMQLAFSGVWTGKWQNGTARQAALCVGAVFGSGVRVSRACASACRLG